MDKIIKQISNEMSFENIDTDDELFFSDKNYKSIPFSTKNFKHARKISSGVKIAFIDGGNREIISASNISVNFVRVHTSIFQNFDKKFSETTEFFSMTKSDKKNNDSISYKTKIFPYRNTLGIIKDENLEFNIDDSSMKQGIFNASISKIVDAIRRFSEIQFAIDLIKTEKLNSGDMIVLDGTLQQSYTNENIYFNQLLELGLKKNILISALAKTSILLTKKGNSATTIINKLSEDRNDRWYYYPLVTINKKEHPAELYFVKLHPKSKFVFRYEIYNKQSFIDVDKVIGYLSLTSQDPVFLGYPYGLIDADAFARVSEEEAKYLQLRFKTLSRNTEIKDNENKAHSILDTIKF